MKAPNSAPVPTDGILQALVKQKDALILQIEAAEGFDKSQSDQLGNLLRSIERVLAIGGALEEKETEMAMATRSQMRDMLTAMEDRTNALATAFAEDRFNKRMDQAAASLCPQCRAQLRADGVAAQPIATTANG